MDGASSTAQYLIDRLTFQYPPQAQQRCFLMKKQGLSQNFKIPVDTSRLPPYMAPRRPDGGIGRRASFRCWYSQGCGGSSPLLGTIPF